ncbi:MAG: hypothetical protein ABI364_06590 [Caldimonas sp.]
MARALFLLAKAALPLVALLVSGAAAAGNANGEAPKRPTNSFSLLYSAAAPQTPVVVPGNGTGIAPGRAVVVNPYRVPLIQNAGTLKAGR